jgi:hypothetical protein
VTCARHVNTSSASNQGVTLRRPATTPIIRRPIFKASLAGLAGFNSEKMTTPHGNTPQNQIGIREVVSLAPAPQHTGFKYPVTGLRSPIVGAMVARPAQEQQQAGGQHAPPDVSVIGAAG